MGIVALVLGMFSIDTQEFRETANAQMKDGYKWEYIGKTCLLNTSDAADDWNSV